MPSSAFYSILFACSTTVGNGADVVADHGNLHLSLLQLQAVATKSGVPRDHDRSTGKGCTAHVPHNRRILVQTVVQAYHGSTAAEQLLMSSRNVSTLCWAGTWQCEGHWLFEEEYGGEFIGANKLETYSSFWDLRRPVFLEKNDRLMSPAPDLVQNFWEQAISPFSGELPRAMRDFGITNLDMVFLIVWRPICLRGLSSHAMPDIGELKSMNRSLNTYNYLKTNGFPVLVLNLGDVLFNRHYNERRLNQWLPCTGGVDSEFVPALGQDIFFRNAWKVKGSIADYALGLKPIADLSYNISTCECMDKASFLPELSEDQRLMAEDVHERLVHLSRDGEP